MERLPGSTVDPVPSTDSTPAPLPEKPNRVDVDGVGVMLGVVVMVAVMEWEAVREEVAVGVGEWV